MSNAGNEPAGVLGILSGDGVQVVLRHLGHQIVHG